MSDEPSVDVLARDIQHISQRLDKIEAKYDGYFWTAGKGILAAALFVLWEPLKKLLEILK